ncbi:hypothetical protein HA402_014895 [Bradysia odoriphaga]|nr:hypothetical protein HA402_014895 [Bradysia odoriphaga]
MELQDSLIRSIENEDDTGTDTVESVVIPPAKSRILIMEPAVLLLFFAWSVTGTVFQNQVIYQTCTEIFHFNKSECILLGTPNATNETEAIESIVQPYAAKFFMAKTIVESLFPALASMFIGPWSDKFGRKPVIMTTFIGYFIIYASVTVISYLSTLVPVNPWFYLLPYIPISICGGNCALITGIFSYVTDITTPSDRPARMSYLQAGIYVGLLFGFMSSSYILQLTSPTIVFGISGLATLLGVLYVIFFVEESIQQDESVGKLTKLKAIFDVSLVTDMVRTCFKSRDNLDRSIIWMTISSLVLSIFALEGSSTVFYLFVREKFNWSIQQSTFFDAANILLKIIGNVLGMYLLNKVLRVSETNLAIISYLSCFADYFIKALASQPWHLYVATSIAIFRGMSGPMCRAILSNTVPVNEIGKIYSLTTSMESISPLGSATLYSFVYSHTLNTFPGAFNLISSGVCMICAVLMIAVFICLKRHPPVGYVTVAQ